MKKRLTSALMAMLLAAALFAGCSDNAGAPPADGVNAGGAAASGSEGYALNPLGQMPLVNGSAEFTVLLPWVDPETKPEDNWSLHEYEKMTGVHVVWQVVPADGWKEKRAITIASGNLPDYIAATANFGEAVFTDTEILQYGTQGIFVDLKQHLPDNSIYLKKILEDNPVWEQIISSSGGKLYSVPDFNVCYHCMYSMRGWINKSWLDRLGLAMPETTDEYKNVLMAFKEQDANGNGDPSDEIPMTSCIDGWNTYLYGFLMNSFIYTNAIDQLNVDPATNQIYYAPTREEYREGLRYLNDLYANGLIAPEAFTQDGKTMAQSNESGDSTIIGSLFGGTQSSTLGYTVSQRFKEYDLMPPLEGPSGLKQTPYIYTGAETGLGAITSAAKDPALIVRWLDFMYSEEGTIMGDLGQEGVNWRPGAAGQIDYRGNPAKYLRIIDPNVTNFSWGQTFGSNRSKEYRESMSVAGSTLDWRETEQGDLELQLFKAAELYEQYEVDHLEVLPKLSIDPEKSTDYILKKTSIGDYTAESLSRFIVGDLSLDNDWDAFQNTLLQLGLEDYIAISQEAYESKYGK
ncbi:MAG: extracellular solute-binding protein [Clostridiales bacterium]|jgi:putative aldouronate transport system substrate-binding protein|nr:extracellular solute-binding protein [Clostridiales bacterium]